MVSTGCAHRHADTIRLGAPPPPPRTQNEPTDHRKRADEALERLRQQMQRRTPDHARRGGNTEGAQPTDAAEEPARRALGTTWSVVTSQGPSPGAPEPMQTEWRTAAESHADQAADTHPRANLFGGVVAALCATLAIRKRVRESRGIQSPTRV